MALPKGRMQAGVSQLLADAGLRVLGSERDYRPSLNCPDMELKMLKPQNIVEMLGCGSMDAGFAGADWIAELAGELDAVPVEVLDTGLDPVRVVAAAPSGLLEGGQLPRRSLVVASEYENLAQSWIGTRSLNARFVRSYGATEVFPPEDADCVVDNTASGSTLRANGLIVVDELMRSTTRLYASAKAMDNPQRRERIEWLAMLCKSVLEARGRVMLEVNVDERNLERLLRLLPALKEPTVSRLRGDAGYAVKVAAPRSTLPQLIPAIRLGGGSGIVITEPSQIVV